VGSQPAVFDNVLCLQQQHEYVFTQRLMQPGFLPGAGKTGQRAGPEPAVVRCDRRAGT